MLSRMLYVKTRVNDDHTMINMTTKLNLYMYIYEHIYLYMHIYKIHAEMIYTHSKRAIISPKTIYAFIPAASIY